MANDIERERTIRHLQNVVTDPDIYNEIIDSYTYDYSDGENPLQEWDILARLQEIQPLDVQRYIKNYTPGLFAASKDDTFLQVPLYSHPGVSDRAIGFTYTMPHGTNVPYFLVDPKTTGETEERANMTMIHEMEHGLLNKTRPDTNYMEEPQTYVFEEAGGNANKFREAFKLVAPYLEEKYGFYLQPSLSENLTELSAVEQARNVDFTDDPYLRKNLFKNHSDRVAYRATSGLRKTKLDAKDLKPYEPVPEGDISIWQRIKEAITPSTYKRKQPTAGIGEPIVVDMNDPLYNNPLLQDPFK
jgi:hypothetical protein